MFIDPASAPRPGPRAEPGGLPRGWLAAAILSGSGRPAQAVLVSRNIRQVVALSFCRNAGIAITRRRIGGGALGPDRDQLIFTYAANAVDRRPEQS